MTTPSTPRPTAIYAQQPCCPFCLAHLPVPPINPDDPCAVQSVRCMMCRMEISAQFYTRTPTEVC